MTEHDKIRLETVRFLRGKYRLDEVAGMYYNVPCVRFRQGKKTVVSINLRDDHYDFQIVLGKVEREKFEAVKHEFPLEIQELYDRQRTLHDGKWLLIPVADLNTLDPGEGVLGQQRLQDILGSVPGRRGVHEVLQHPQTALSLRLSASG